MQINFFTIISKIFYTIIFIYIFIIDRTYNYVYGHGYEQNGQDFTVPTDYCSFYVGPQARNPVSGYASSGWASMHHSFHIKTWKMIYWKYDEMKSITREWQWGKFKVEYYYESMHYWGKGSKYWLPVSTTERNMAKTRISCTSPSDSPKTIYYGLFNLTNTSSDQRTTTHDMYVTDRTIECEGRLMNIAPLAIGYPKQGEQHTYAWGGAHTTIPSFTVKTGIAMLGHSRANLPNDPEVDDPNFAKFQNSIRRSRYPKNAEDVGGRFKVYAGFLFFHRVNAHIYNHGKIQGYYGISASCPMPYRGERRRVIDGTGFHGAIHNKSLGIISGDKAAIDIDAGAGTYTSIGDVMIINEESAIIYGPIIIPDIQKGIVNNSGSIVPNTTVAKASTMELKLGNLGTLRNNNEAVIRTHNLFIGKTNRDSTIMNYGYINIKNILSAPTVINYSSGQLSIPGFSDTVGLYDNYGRIAVSNETSITEKEHVRTHTNSMISAKKSITIDNRYGGNFINEGSITVISGTLYSFDFTNAGYITTKIISGNSFINNGDVIGLSLKIDANTINNNNFNIGNLMVCNSFANIKSLQANNLTIKATVLTNKGSTSIKDNILTTKSGEFYNDVGAKLTHFGNNFFFDEAKIKITNKGCFTIQHNLILKSNLTTEATFIIGNLFSINENKLIKTANSSCYIENLVDGIIQNLGDITIKNVTGKGYIDYFTPITKTKVTANAEFHIDHLSAGSSESYIVNNGSITINADAELNESTIANYGDVISFGNTKFIGPFAYTNRGNFTFGTGVTLDDSDFVFYHFKAGKKVTFLHNIKTNFNIVNQAILQLNQPVSLASYRGDFEDDIVINTGTQTSSSTAYLSADSIEIFAGQGNPKTRIIINANQIYLNSEQTITLLESKDIDGIRDFNGEIKSCLYGDIGYLSKLSGYKEKDVYQTKKLVLVAGNPKIIKTKSKNEQLVVNCQWLYTPKDFYRPDSSGIYSMDYINRLIYGYISPGINFNIFCDGPIKKWYIDKSKLYVGRINENLPLTNIDLVTSNIPDTFSITSLYTTTSIGSINVLSSIEANKTTLQANALAIRTKKAINQSYSHTELPAYQIYVLDKIYIDKTAKLVGGQQNNSGLELACLLTGNIENHGVITGHNGINIVGPLNYIDGKISNYGNITAKIVINTHMNIPYGSDKSRKCIITNYKKMQGDFILGGYNCDFINEGSVISQNEGIIGRYSNNNTINNKGEMNVSHINIEESSSTLNLINSGNLHISRFSVLNHLTNNNYLIAKQDLGIINLLSNNGVLIAPKINTSEDIQLKYNTITPNATVINSGTLIIKTSFTSASMLTNESNGVIRIKEDLILLSDDFTNQGMIYADKSIQMKKPNITNAGLLSTDILSITNNLDLGYNGSVYTKQIKSINKIAHIKGNGDLFITNEVINFDTNLDISTDNLSINADEINIYGEININTNKLIVNDNHNICDINISPESQLALRYSNPISKNINLINNGTLELISVLQPSLATPLHEFTNYTANRGSKLNLQLPDLLSTNNEITDLSMPLIKIDKIAKLDKTSTKINISPIGYILRGATTKVTILQANSLCDENDVKLISADSIINKSFTTENIELILKDIEVENNSIIATINLIDKRRLGPNMRRAKLLISSKLLGKSYRYKDKKLFGVAYTYNHKVTNLKAPVNSASLTSAYTDNIILSPISIIDYGLYFDAQVLTIKPDDIAEITSILDIPALVIGTDILPDKFFKGRLNNYITFDSIKLSNLVINGKKDYKQKKTSADGLVIGGSNDLRLKDGIYFDENTQLLAGANNHALNFACHYVGDIINHGVIGDGINYSSVHLNQPIEGTLTNKGKITANVNAIDITTGKPWPQGKSFEIVNNGEITGSIVANCNPNTDANTIKIVNYGDIIAGKIESNCNNINIHNMAGGKLKITDLIKVSAENFINEGVLEAKNLLLESNLTSVGNIFADYLQGDNYKLTAPYIKAKNIESVFLKADSVTVSSLILKKVIVDATLMISGKAENQGELTTPILQFATNSNLTNKGSVKIISPIINLDNSVFNNLGNLEVSGTLNLTGDFNTARGKLLVNTLKLNANNLYASEAAIIDCNYLINTTSNSNIVMQKGTAFQLGNDMATTTTISGNINFSQATLSDYMQNKYQVSLKLNANLTCNNGLLQTGNIITDNKKPIFLTIENKAQMLCDLPIKEEKLHIVNHGALALVDNNNLYSYKGENAIIEMSLQGQNTDTVDSLLTTNDQIIFDHNSIIRLQPSIDALSTLYSYTILFTAPLNKIIYKNSSGSTNVITTENVVSLINKQENNKKILRLKDIKVTHTATNSIVSAIIGIKNIANFPNYMTYLDQQLHSNLLVDPCCDTTKTIEGMAWGVNYKNKIIQSNNLIISPYSLVDTSRVARFDITNKVLYLVSPQKKPTYIGITNNYPAVVIGTEITSTDATQKIIANNNSILTIDSIFLDNIIIDGSKKIHSNFNCSDGLLITGSNALHINKFLEIGTNCILKSQDDNHPLHIATKFNGNINNFGIIGDIDPHTQKAILISQPYSGTITNYNIIQAINTALTVKSEADWNSNNKLSLVNKGKIIGGIIINKSANAKQDININLINYGHISNYHGDDDDPCKIIHDKKTKLYIYNKDNAGINMSILVATEIINKGAIVTSQLEFNQLKNYGVLILGGTDTFKINDNNFINHGLLHLTKEINLTGDFTNNGTIETISNIDTKNYNLTNRGTIKSKANINTNFFINATNSIVSAPTLNIGLPTGRLKNYGSIFVDSLIQQGILANNYYLQINNPVKLTAKIINNGTLEVVSSINLTGNYDNNGYIKTNILDGEHLTIINTNSLAKTESAKLQNITIKGDAIITKEITGTVNVTNLYSNTNIDNYGKLTVDSWLNKTGKIINYGSVKINDFQINNVLNYGSLTAKTLNSILDGLMQVDNYGYLYANTFNLGKLNNYNKGYAFFANINDSNIVNQGILKVSNSLVNDIIIEGSLQIVTEVQQHGDCQVGFITGDSLKIYGTINAATVNVKYLYNKNTLNVDNKLTIDTNNKLDNYHNITTGFIDIKGKVVNKKLANLNITKQDSTQLADKNCINHGNIITKNNILIYDTFNCSGSITAVTINVAENAKLMNTGNIYLSYIHNNLLSSKRFENKAKLTVANDAIIQEQFINDGVITANKISSLNQNIKFINNAKSLAKFNIIEDINIVNNGVFNVKHSILGNVNITGSLILENDINQNGSLFVDNIQAASNISSINFNIKNTSFCSISTPLIDTSFDIVNNGCLYLKPESTINSYVSHGGILKIYLPLDLSTINKPLLSAANSIELYSHLNEKPLIVLLADNFTKITQYQQKQQIIILEAKKILLNKDNIQQSMLADILAVQDALSIDDSLISDSILLNISSSRVETTNKISIYADVYWEEIKNIKGLLSHPLSLSKLAIVLQKEKAILHKKKIFSDTKSNIKNGSTPKETSEIINSLSKTMNIDQLLLLPFPENSSCHQELIISSINEAASSLSKRLLTDRISELYHNQNGINSGSLYQNLYVWSSLSFQKENNNKQSLYPYGDSTSKILNFGIDTQFTRKLKIGFMLANIATTAKTLGKTLNAEYNVTRNYEAKGILSTVYFSQMLNICTLNLYLNTAKYKFNQNMHCALSGKAAYNASLFGIHGEVIYPFSYKNLVLEFAELIRVHSIYLETCNFENKLISYKYHRNIVNVGVSASCFYNIPLILDSQLYLGCAFTYLYNFAPSQQQHIAVSYFDNDFNITQQIINQHNIKIDSLINLTLFNKLKLAVNAGIGFKSSSRYLNGKLKLNYSF